VPVRADGLSPGQKVTVGIRPEHVAVDPQGTLRGEAIVAEHLGALTVLHVAIDKDTTILVQADGKDPTRAHMTVGLHLDPFSCHVFGPDGMALTNLDAHAEA